MGGRPLLRPCGPHRRRPHGRFPARQPEPGGPAPLNADATTCPVCGHEGAATAVADLAATDVPERFGLVRCAGCDVLRTWPVPDDLTPYYATDLASTMTKPHSRIFASLRAVQLARELARITRAGGPGPLVDVGCGAGDFVRVAATRHHAVIAADAGERPPLLDDRPQVRFVRFDFDSYTLAGAGDLGPFTAVLRHVLEHVRDPVACLAALRRQGARQIYVVAPNAASHECRLLGTAWYLWDPPRHLWHFTPATVARTCERAGFTPIIAGTDTSPILLPSLYRALRLRHVPRPIYELFGPTSLLTAVTAPLNLALPGNVLWLLARGAPDDCVPPERVGERTA